MKRFFKTTDDTFGHTKLVKTEPINVTLELLRTLGMLQFFFVFLGSQWSKIKKMLGIRFDKAGSATPSPSVILTGSSSSSFSHTSSPNVNLWFFPNASPNIVISLVKISDNTNGIIECHSFIHAFSIHERAVLRDEVRTAPRTCWSLQRRETMPCKSTALISIGL